MKRPGAWPWLAHRSVVARVHAYTLAVALLAAGTLALLVGTPLARRERQLRSGLASHLAQEALERWREPPALRQWAERVRGSLGHPVAFYDVHHQRVAGHGVGLPGPLASTALARHVPGELFVPDDCQAPCAGAVLVGTGERLLGYAVLSSPGASALGAVWMAAGGLGLVALGVLSWAFGRSLREPLERLTATINAVAEGQLEVNTGLRHQDEFGQVARAVEWMADSVSFMNRSQTQMLANLSHELRTPLARVRVALDIASDFDGPGARESLRNVSEDLTELEQLFGDVLALARFELAEGRRARLEGLLRMEPLEPRELVAKAAARFRAAHPSRVLQLHLEEPLPRIRGDSRLLRRVLENLLENGRKYSQPTSELTLKARRVGDELSVEVVDAGIGIDAADLPHVFTPFFRAERSRSRATGGVGLGLTLALRIAEAHGGTLQLASARGVGTTASLRVPVLGAPRELPPAARPVP